jgi:hopanoid biosynthesis associated RND transporter like protein HpnN
MRSDARSFHLSEPLRALTRAVASRPWLTLALTFAAAFVSVLLTVLLIEFRTERADLIDPNADFHRRWISYTEAFGASSDLVVVVEGDDADAIKTVMEELGRRLAAETDRFSHVLFKIEPGQLRRKGLQYLSPEQLEEALNRLQAFRPVLDDGWDRMRLDLLVLRLQLQVQDRRRELDAAGAQVTDADTKRTRDTLQHVAQLAGSLEGFLRNREFANPWPEFVSVEDDRRHAAREVVYLMNEAGTIGFLKARPVQQEQDFNGATPSIDRLRAIIAETAPRHRSVRIGLTGIPVLESDEMRRSQSDMIKASLVSFFGVGVLLLTGFRGWRHPLLAMLTLAVAMCWAFGYTTLVVGHLNILSVSFAAILIGLGIDFAIHYLARYLELRHERPEEGLLDSLCNSSAGVGVGIVTAAVTTSLAFFCATWTDFLGVAELGIIAGGGVVLCAAATFLVLPALVAVSDRQLTPQQLPTPFQGSLLRAAIRRWPKSIALLSVAVVGVVGWHGVSIEGGQLRSRVAYDYNLLNLQDEGLESVAVQERIFHNADGQDRPGQGSLLYAVSLADSPAQARQLREQFLQLPTVHHVEELATRMPEFPADQTQLLVQGFRAQLARLPDSLPEAPSVNPVMVGQSLEKLLELLPSFDSPLARQAEGSIDRLLDRLDPLELEDQVRVLVEFQQRTTAALLSQFRMLRDVADPEPVTLDDLPIELTSRFVSSTGQWLLQVYPRDPVWDIEPLRRFVVDVRSVDPEVTGTPLQNYEASQQIMRSYQYAAVYALAAVSLVLLIDFLGPRPALQTLLPSAVITVCIAGAQVAMKGKLDGMILLGSFMALMVSLALAIDWRSVAFTLLTLQPPLAGGLLMYGVMALLGVDFNPANLIVLPLILGIGVDDGVHVLHDYRSQQGSVSYRMSASTMNAIVLTSLTSMIGFGSMMLAAHRGLYSLGMVLVIGVGSCLFVSLVPLPAVLTIARGRSQSSDVDSL